MEESHSACVKGTREKRLLRALIYGMLEGSKANEMLTRDALHCKCLRMLDVGEDSSDVEASNEDDVDKVQVAQSRRRVRSGKFKKKVSRSRNDCSSLSSMETCYT